MPSARIQPQGLVRLNRSNPLSVGLVSLIVPGGSVDAVRRKPVTLSGGATVGVSKHGKVWQGATGGTVDIGASGGLQTLLDTTKSFEFYTRIYVSDASSRQMPMADFDVNGNGHSVDLEIQAGGAWFWNALNTGNASSIASGGTATVGWHDISAVVTYAGANFQTSLYVDGALIGTGQSLPGPLRTSTGSLRLMSAGAYLFLGLTGQMPIWAAWNRNLSQDERAAIRRNPWQLVDGQAPMLYAASAPATSSTGTFTGTFGAATTSGAGVVQVSAALTKALGGLSVSSAGALADAGALNQSFGGMTSAAAGAVAVAANASNALAGMTITADGTAAVAGRNGTLVATMGGATAASAGTVAVVGNLSATLGAVTISATGTAANAGVNGALNATLSGMTATSAGQAAIAATMARSIGGVATTSAGAVGVTGSLSATVGGLSIVTAAGGSASAALSKQFGGMTAAGTGQVAIQAQAGANLGGMTLGAAAATQNTAGLSAALGGIATAATGAIAVRGAASVTFGSIQPGLIHVAQLSATLGGAGLVSTGRVYYFSRSPLRTVRVLAQNRTARIPAQDRKTSGRI